MIHSWLYTDELMQEDFDRLIKIRFKKNGILDQCKGCKQGCVQYNANNLLKFHCNNFK